MLGIARKSWHWRILKLVTRLPLKLEVKSKEPKRKIFCLKKLPTKIATILNYMLTWQDESLKGGSQQVKSNFKVQLTSL